MGAKYRRSIGSNAITPIKDFTINAAYALVAKPYDLVKLDASGEVVAAATDNINLLGTFEGLELKQQGETVTQGKVRTNPTATYEIPYVGGTPLVGVSYPITVTAGDGGVLNAAKQTTSSLRVISVDTATQTAEVQISSRVFT